MLVLTYGTREEAFWINSAKKALWIHAEAPWSVVIGG